MPMLAGYGPQKLARLAFSAVQLSMINWLKDICQEDARSMVRTRSHLSFLLYLSFLSLATFSKQVYYHLYSEGYLSSSQCRSSHTLQSSLLVVYTAMKRIAIRCLRLQGALLLYLHKHRLTPTGLYVCS